MKSPLRVVRSQIKSAKPELAKYPPVQLDWYSRCLKTANSIVPWLETVAPELKVYIEEVLNSPTLVRSTWHKIKTIAAKHVPGELHKLIDRELDREAVLLSYVGGNIVSKVVEKYLIDNYPGKLESNGASDYPDLFLRSENYDDLPSFSRKVREYGAARKGNNRPVRVPDGLEIKTCLNRFAVDCHHAHAGLHLALLYRKQKGLVEVFDILVAFMRYEDYRITKPSTPTTTLKASFNGANFVSLLNQI